MNTDAARPRRAQTGPADLVRAHVAGDRELALVVARMLGFEWVEVAAPPTTRVEPPPALLEAPGQTSSPAASQGITSSFVPVSEYPDVPFWAADRFEAVEVGPRVETARSPFAAAMGGSGASSAKTPEPPAFLPLEKDSAVLTTLRSAVPSRECGSDLDIERIIDHWGRGQLMEVVPRRRRKAWGHSIQVVIDESRRLVPYWDDQLHVLSLIQAIYPVDGLSVAVVKDGENAPRFVGQNRGSPYRPPAAGSIVLVLGDLGALEAGEGGAVRFWVEWGHKLREEGVLPLALVPCRPKECGPLLGRVWKILGWEQAADRDDALWSDDTSQETEKDILALLSFALRVEPQLIRFARRLFGAGQVDPGLEAKLWANEAFVSRHHEAAAFHREKAERLRGRLAGLDRKHRDAMFKRVHALHANNAPDYWTAEVLGLGDDVAAGLITKEQQAEAIARIEAEQRALRVPGTDAKARQAAERWHRWLLGRLPASAWTGEQSRMLHELWAMVHRDQPETPPPALAQPEWLIDPQDPSTQPEQIIELVHQSGQILARPFRPHDLADHASRTGSPIGLIRVNEPRIKVEVVDIAAERLANGNFWPEEERPRWASASGIDGFGPWVEFQVKGVTQRMRWVPPRSKRNWGANVVVALLDTGVYEAETEIPGFWMFDTPCTQALWEAVMGTRPSWFKGDALPVQNVSWEDCQEFVERLVEVLGEVRFSLPTEMQWEHACRAGTADELYHEDLNEIAWSHENSGLHPHPVGLKLPNAWGLYDMLGNVDEWCVDDDWGFAVSMPDVVAAGRRGIRGGSWGLPRSEMSASRRFSEALDHRDRRLGFRLLLWRGPEPVLRSENAASKSRHPKAPARWLSVGREAQAIECMNVSDTIRVRSDRESLTFQPMTKPSWASAMGRDRFGLWAEFALENVLIARATPFGGRSKSDVEYLEVRQRMRWIPPGRFTKGSAGLDRGILDGDRAPREMMIEQGFWMFDTPCTQALWTAVVGSHPSDFQSADRPVETVSWRNCQRFIIALKEKTGIELRLPSEAQWEYACRAGTTEATYAGDLNLITDFNAPVLDEIAWYGGNSGVSFDLKNGVNVSSIKGKQYDFAKAGTHAVGRKLPNAWGLFDMLGNVFEWCDDVWTYDSGMVPSGRSPDDQFDREHVLKGGSWSSVARLTTAAAQMKDQSTAKNLTVGFRLAEYREGVELGCE